jgi:hypothetical protein
MPGDLRLDGEHHYWVDQDRYLGACESLAAVGLLDDRWFTEEASLRGTYAHQAIEWALKGELDEAALDPALCGYVDAALRYLKDAGAEVLLVEQPLSDALYRVAGTPDAVVRSNGSVKVIDWKTGGPAPWHRWQLAIYWHLVGAEKLAPVIETVGVYLSNDGTYTTKPFRPRDDWKIAQAAITVAWAQRANA